MDALLEKLIHSPRLLQYRDQIDDVLRDEQERRRRFYDQITEDDRWEFINGEIIVHSPAKWNHNDATLRLASLMRAYVTSRKLGKVGSEKCLITLTRNDYEPDVCFWDRDVAAGITEHQLQFPAPQLAVEVISPSTEANDRGVKFEDYAAHGVKEYWIIDPDGQSVEQHVLEGESFSLRMKSTSGTIRSVAVEGSEISIRAIFDDEENLAALRRLTAP